MAKEAGKANMHKRNVKRAKRIRKALKSEREYDMSKDNTKYALAAALADVLHLCDLEEVKYGDVVSMAIDHYTFELQHPED